jgi:hypothetical protein
VEFIRTPIGIFGLEQTYKEYVFFVDEEVAVKSGVGYYGARSIHPTPMPLIFCGSRQPNSLKSTLDWLVLRKWSI